MHNLQFDIIREDQPSEQIKELFARNWPAYKRWFLDEGEGARATYFEGVQALKEYMPELLPRYHQLLELLDCDDLQARFLSLYCPPPFYSGCSQLIVKQPRAALIRNYDFPPILCEANILSSQWQEQKVIAMTDCLWGVLDGMNDAGLAVSIAYGGRLIQGKGFGITLVVRYLLETCQTVAQAIAALERIPVHLDYNIALVDKAGDHATVFIAPDADICVTRGTASTNQQSTAPNTVSLTLADSGIRLDTLNQLSSPTGSDIDYCIRQFLQPPLYRPHHIDESGTLYTAAYFPEQGRVQYIWPHSHVDLAFDQIITNQINIQY